MSKISRRAFSGAVLAAPAVAVAQEQNIPARPARMELPAWKAPAAGGDPFDLPALPSPRTRWAVA